MLQDTDLFDKLAGYSFVGGDVSCSLDWEESVSPDERYTINLTWRFRGKMVGGGSYVIEPVLNSESYRLFWIDLWFEDDWQNKGLYSTLVQSYKAKLPSYGIESIVTVPKDKEAERRLASAGFAWVGHEFSLDLNKPA